MNKKERHFLFILDEGALTPPMIPMIETVFQKVVYLVIFNYFICSFIHNGFTYLLAELIVLTNL